MFLGTGPQSSTLNISYLCQLVVFQTIPREGLGARTSQELSLTSSLHVVSLFWRLREFISIGTCHSVPVGLSAQKCSQAYLIYLHMLKNWRPYIKIIYCSIANLLAYFSFFFLLLVVWGKGFRCLTLWSVIEVILISVFISFSLQWIQTLKILICSDPYLIVIITA